jgi:Cytidylate kinase
VGVAASYVGPVPEVRQVLLAFQRNFAAHPPADKQGVVVDGRDIGRVVLSEAPCKIFVIASPEVRAERRLKELQEKGINCTYDSILADIKARDERDETRKASPLKPAEDAYILDTSFLNREECAEKACQYVDSKYPKARKYK